MNQLGIIHPALFEALVPNFYPSRLTVQASTKTKSPTGATIDAWADAAGMISLPCRIAPTGGSESMTQAQVTATNTWTCVIPAFLPNVKKGNRAVVDGMVYGIDNVDYDGQQIPGQVKRSTRLTLKVVA